MNAGADVAVVGAGIVGLATAKGLAERGATVTVYDRAAPGSGQSGGGERIFRHVHDDRRLIGWARESRGIYRRWEEEFGTELVSGDGVVFAIDDAAEALARIEAVGGIEARLIGPEEIAERMPLSAPREGQALLDADGGAIRAARTVAALAGRLGDGLVAEDVLALRPRPGGTVDLFTGGRRVEHGAVVVCAGTSTAAIGRSLGVEIPIVLNLHGRVTFETREAPPASVAALVDATGAFGEPHMYGVSSPDRSRFSVGVAETPGREDLSLLAPEEIGSADDRAAAWVARALPGLEPTPVDYRHCWVSEVPWAEDGVAAWETESIHLVAGNNLFKHAPALGIALAEAALGGELHPELRPDARLGAPFETE